MLATARSLVQRLGARLSAKVAAAAVTGLTVGGGVLPALIIALGECSVTGSPGC